jgi:hypothetical protein
VTLPWVAIQVKRLGTRDMAFEVGCVDTKGCEGVFRFSSFKVGLDTVFIVEGVADMAYHRKIQRYIGTDGHL